MTESYLYIYLIAALLPLAAAMVVLQVNPLHALIMRGVLGAMAALTYTVLGAADVALTEALVGTLLAITLYAVAVRSSLVMRLGILEDVVTSAKVGASGKVKAEGALGRLLDSLRIVLDKHYMRLELVPYMSEQALNQALIQKDVHAICGRSLLSKLEKETGQGSRSENESRNQLINQNENGYFHTMIRVPRLYEIMKNELPPSSTKLIYVAVTEQSATHLGLSDQILEQLSEEGHDFEASVLGEERS